MAIKAILKAHRDDKKLKQYNVLGF